MKKLLIMSVLLLTAKAMMAGTPKVDPTPCFKGYPWAANATTTWWRVESTNRMIAQLFFALQDRGQAVGVYDHPQYSKLTTLYAGDKTNYTYLRTNDVWNGTNYDRIILTNRPTLLCQLTTNLANKIRPFKYTYPKDPAVNDSGVNETNGYCYVDKALIDELYDTLERVAPYYVPASIMLDGAASYDFESYSWMPNIGTYLNRTNNFGEHPPMPKYCMPLLVKDAGYTNYNPTATNDWGLINGGTWSYTYDMRTGGSYRVTLKGLDELATMVAQLKFVIHNYVATTYGCERTQFQNFSGGTWIDQGDIPPSYRSYALPFGWMQRSKYDAKSFSITPTNVSGTYIEYYINIEPQIDWPLTGWYCNGALDIDIRNLIRDDLARELPPGTPSQYWGIGVYRGFGYDVYYDYWTLQVNYETNIASLARNESFTDRRINPLYAPSSTQIHSTAYSFGFNSFATRNITNYYDNYSSQVVASNTSYNVVSNFWDHTNRVDPSFYLVSAKYDTNNTNTPPAFVETVTLVWSNTQAGIDFTNRCFFQASVTNNVYTNFVTTNYTFTGTTTNIFEVSNAVNSASATLLDGTWTISGTIESPQIIDRQFTYAYEPDMPRFFQNPDITDVQRYFVYVYAKGCPFGTRSEHLEGTYQAGAYGDEWVDPSLGYTFCSDAFISPFFSAPVVTTNSYVFMDKLLANNYQYSAIKDYPDIMRTKMNDKNTARVFVGLSDIKFIIDYKFTNRWEKGTDELP